MKILQINVVYKDKSTGRTCSEVEKALIQEGHQCITAYGYGKHPNEKNAYRIDTKFEYAFHNIASRITGREGYFSYFATRRLIRFIERYNPDVVHLRNIHGHYLNLPLLFRYLAQKQYPVIQNLHDCWAFTGKCAYYTTIGCYKWKTECGDCPKIREYPQSLVFDHTKKMKEDKEKWYGALDNLYVVGVSDWTKREAEQSFFRENAKSIQRIYNWINQSVFKPYGEMDCETRAKYGIPQDKYMIIGVSANWNPGTPRYEDFMKLAQMLREDEVLVLVGKAEKQFEEKAIKHIQFVSDTSELARLYSCADVYVHCSIEDTFGKVVAEALACGIPAVVYNITGCAEIVDNESGVRVEPRSVEGIRAAIDKLKMQSKAFYKKSCVERVESEFNYEKNVHQLIELYQKVVGCK